MALPNKGPAENNKTKSVAPRHYIETSASASARLAKELFGGRYSAGQRLDLRAVAAEFDIDLEMVLKAFTDLPLFILQTQRRCTKLMRFAPLWKKSPAGLRPRH